MKPGQQWFHDSISALAYSLAKPHENSPELLLPHNDLTRFILTQHAQMPDYLRAPMKLATLGFDLFGLLRGGNRFHHQSPEQRVKQIVGWKNSGISFHRDLIRYFGDDPHKSNEAKLEAIQMAWFEEWKDNQ